MQPGKINNRGRAQQIIDFSGLRYKSPSMKGDITPTDIDGFLEYDDKCSVFVEVKLEGTPLKYGQRLALERLVDDTNNKPAILFIAEHNVENCSDDVDAAKCTVKKYYHSNEWKNWNGKGFMLRQVIDAYLAENAGYKIPRVDLNEK